MIIRNAIERYKATKPHSYHTPGHKGTLSEDDITELVGGAYFPSDAVQKAEAEVAKIYGAAHLRFLTGGSSMGVKAAIMACGGDIIAWAYSHKSVFDGAKLIGKKVITVGSDKRVPPSAHEIAASLKFFPSVAAVVVTSPTYYGFCAALSDIRLVCDTFGVRLIVDGAHGAHFPSSPLFPECALKYCDVMNASAHKTLATFNPGAIVATSDFALVDELDSAISLLDTTSPSYPLLCSIEEGCMRLATDETRERYKQLHAAIEKFKNEVPCLKNDDFTRVVVDASAMSLTGGELERRLVERGVFPEMSDEETVTFIFTYCDGIEDVRQLSAAINGVL